MLYGVELRASQAVISHAGNLKYPVALAAASENVAFELAGWRTSTGLMLRKPILASLQLTPDIARLGLTSNHLSFMWPLGTPSCGI